MRISLSVKNFMLRTMLILLEILRENENYRRRYPIEHSGSSRVKRMIWKFLGSRSIGWIANAMCKINMPIDESATTIHSQLHQHRE